MYKKCLAKLLIIEGQKQKPEKNGNYLNFHQPRWKNIYPFNRT
jgi:hypothetical protein